MSEAERDTATGQLLEWCKRERELAVEGIARFETGQQTFGSFVSGHLVHRTQEHLSSLHRIVDNMDRIIEACGRRTA